MIRDALRKCHYIENILLRATQIHSLLCTAGDFYVKSCEKFHNWFPLKITEIFPDIKMIKRKDLGEIYLRHCPGICLKWFGSVKKEVLMNTRCEPTVSALAV